MNLNELPVEVLKNLRRGMVVPAQPLALTADRRLDERHQRALTRYYLAAGAGGVAVGVHSTQFEIRTPGIDLFKPVLELAAKTIDEEVALNGRPAMKIAGICGDTDQARREAVFARETGYHAGLLSLSALAKAEMPRLLAHCREIAKELPIIGFYLQPAVGGRVLSYEFWRQFAEIENVLAIKIAPFNRYQTFDVVRAVAEAGRENDIALYTGNDDHIVLDLLTPFPVRTSHGIKEMHIVGGLLGHWCVWTSKAVELLEKCHCAVAGEHQWLPELLTLANEITDSNAAFFDAANQFHGCIPGLHEVLRHQGLMQGIWCLNPTQNLSPGQREEIDRVYAAYPHLNDDEFVVGHLDQWLR
ncbi:MAG: dihydrodipicolinate synthase family protein [Candidatus Marinimicrobia bacterium]|nr:dihydrodipicolinate synthase family protein [Candidatus Neomarinimicrobiota bacterium]